VLIIQVIISICTLVSVNYFSRGLLAIDISSHMHTLFLSSYSVREPKWLSILDMRYQLNSNRNTKQNILILEIGW
jgi:hypothetical protein